MAKLVLLVGISGAGKTTVGEAVARASTIAYRYASTEKFDLLRPGEVLNFLDQQRSYEVNEEVLTKIGSRHGAVLVDTHATYPVGDAFIRLTPPSVCPDLAGIVLVEAGAETIRARRIMRGRAHEPTSLPFIQREILAEREEVGRLSRVYDLPVHGFDSTRVSVARAVPAVIEFVGRLAEPPRRRAGQTA
jgi:adenylate kinase